MIKEQIAAAVARAIPETLTNPQSYSYPLPSWIALKLLEEFKIAGCGNAGELIDAIASAIEGAKSPSDVPMAIGEKLSTDYKIERKVQ